MGWEGELERLVGMLECGEGGGRGSEMVGRQEEGGRASSVSYTFVHLLSCRRK